jgi:crotonobetaine/carnitine-CoA ligase
MTEPASVGGTTAEGKVEMTLDDQNRAPVSAADSNRVEWGPSIGEAWSKVPESSIIELVEDARRRDKHAICLRMEDGGTLTRQELVNRVEVFAGFLSDRISPGGRVGIALANRPEFLVGWLATLAARGVAVLISPDVGTHDGVHMLQDSRVDVLLVEHHQQQRFEAMAERCENAVHVVGVRGNEPDGLAWATSSTPISLRDWRGSRGDTVTINYTSGTTGRPKACALKNATWLRYVDVALRTSEWSPDPVALCSLQMAYGDPLYIFLTALRADGEMVVMRKFSVSRFWDVVGRFGVTHFVGIGAIPSLLLSRAPSPEERQHNMRLAVQIAIPKERHAELVERFGVPWIDAYGLMESGPATTVPVGLADELIGSGSIGIPYPEVETRLIGPAGEDIDGPGEGELALRAPGMFDGYENQPLATEEMLRDGWLFTGDVVRRDERGLLYHLRRNKDVIRRSGSNIAPAEVEEVLREHPAVMQVAVAAVPDTLRGQEVKAYVLLNDSSASIDPIDLVEHCRGRLLDYKIPRYIEFRTEPFPMTMSMRIRKEDLTVAGVHGVENAWDREAGRQRR